MGIKGKIDEKSGTIIIRISECCMKTFIKSQKIKTEKARQKALKKNSGCCKEVLEKLFKLRAEEAAAASARH